MKRATPHLSRLSTAAVGSIVLLTACLDFGGEPVSQRSGLAPEAPLADTAAEDEAIRVQLDLLNRPRPDIAVQLRSPFRFGSRSETSGGGDGGGGGPEVPPPPPPPPPPSPPPPPRPELIGIIESTQAGERIAVLTEADRVFYGRRGEIVEGRYKIVSIGPASVDIESIANGRRSAIRLAATR